MTKREVAESRPGSVVGKRYRIEELINFGGMGALYRARDLEAQRPCALRVLPEAYTRDPEIMNRFMREARAATEIGHPNIIDVFDIGRLEDGSVYSVMELLDGQTVAEILQLEGRLKPERAVHVATQVCRALGTAHESSIIHRDLKPENIVLIFHEGDLDFVKVVDFGIAKHTDDGTTTTSPGLIIGSPDYMAPEQAAGSEAHPASDIYALGCILFEMLTGRLPYSGRNAIDVLMKKGAHDAPRANDVTSSVPEALSDVVAWCLARRPEDRPESMRALEFDLMRAIDPSASQSIRARKVMMSQRAAADPGVSEAEGVTESPIAKAVGTVASPEPEAAPAARSTPPARVPEPSDSAPALDDEPETESGGGKLLGVLALGVIITAVALYVVKPELFTGVLGGAPDTEEVTKRGTAPEDSGKAPSADSEVKTSNPDAPPAATTGAAVTPEESAGAESDAEPAGESDLVAVIAKADLAIVESRWKEPKGKSLFDYLGQIEAMSPGHEAITRLKQDAEKSMSPAGEKAIEEERWHDAVQTYKALLELDPEQQKKIAKPYLQALLQEGRLLRGLKNFEGMLSNADEALKLNKKSYDAHILRGDALGELGRWADAVPAYQEAVKIRKTSTDAKRALKNAKKMAKSG